ncbi:MAG: BatA domain-containing protein [Singulisphaera sp.]
MGFVQIGFLGALATLTIPVIIHLMFRTQARTVDLGTLQFLKIVLRDNARKRRLKRWILLALRMACVALIALLFARPFLLATEPLEGQRLVVVLVDRSASMGLKGAGGRSTARSPSAVDRGAAVTGTRWRWPCSTRPSTRSRGRATCETSPPSPPRVHQLRRGDGLGARPLRPFRKARQGGPHPDRPPRCSGSTAARR